MTDSVAAREGDAILTRRGHWHGFDSNSNEEVTPVWGWSGAGSIDSAGYEVSHQSDLDH